MNLPGAIHKAYPEDKCENHPDIQAVVNVQGETDSMGCELHPFCQVCFDKYKAKPDYKGECDWCHSQDVERQPTRDYDEGMSGPVYYVCRPCILKRDREAHEEYEALRREEEQWEHQMDIDDLEYQQEHEDEEEDYV